MYNIILWHHHHYHHQSETSACSERINRSCDSTTTARSGSRCFLIFIMRRVCIPFLYPSIHSPDYIYYTTLHYTKTNTKKDTNSDKKTTRVLQTILTQEPSPPQLAVLNGDLISGEAVSSHSKPSTYIDQIVSPLVKQGIPWATTHGNHDSEMHLDPEQTFNHEKRYRLSLTRKMVSEPAAGYTNYYLSVYPSRGSNGAGGGGGNDSAPAMILWFFDTRGGHYPIRKTDRQDAVPRPNWVHESVCCPSISPVPYNIQYKIHIPNKPQ